MKAAYKNDWEAIAEIFKFWYDRGFVDENKEIILYFMEYIYNTHEISRDKLKKMLDESKIDGGDLMQTLAQQMKEEFKEEFMETLGPQLKEEAKKETAKQMLLDNIPIEKIVKYTGLTEKEVKALIN